MSAFMSRPIRRRRVTAASPTPEKLGSFLRHLADSGSVSLAAERTGIARNTVYLRRKADPAFALGWRNAVELAAGALRDAAIARAHGGDDRLLMFLLRMLRPEIYGQVRRLGVRRKESSGSCGPAISEFSDRHISDNSCP